MKKVLSIVVSIVTFSCHAQLSALKNNVYSELEMSKAESLETLVKSFESFLKETYSTEQTEARRIKEFLEAVRYLHFDSTWKFNQLHMQESVRAIESSGMRRELYLKANEEYIPSNHIEELVVRNLVETSVVDSGELVTDFEDILLPDDYFDHLTIEEKELRDQFMLESLKRWENSYYFNVQGSFLYLLAKNQNLDSLISNYVEAKYLIGDISPSLIASGYLDYLDVESYDAWFNKMVVIIEIYYPFIISKF